MRTQFGYWPLAHNPQLKKMNKFQIREYGFGELAELYYPDRDPRTVARAFREEIEKTRNLKASLKLLGYRGNERVLTRNQVKKIVKFLGEP